MLEAMPKAPKALAMLVVAYDELDRDDDAEQAASRLEVDHPDHWRVKWARRKAPEAFSE